MIILQGQGLARLFGADVLFQNINITVQDRSRIALVGRNGTGKSTLLKILAGLEQSDQGEVSLVKNLTMGYLDQHSAVDSSKTIYQEMLSVFEETIAQHKRLEALSMDLARLAEDPSSPAYERALSAYEQLQHHLEETGGYHYETRIKSILNGFRFGPESYETAISSLSGGQKTRLAMAKILLEEPQLLILDEPTNHLDIETLNWLENYLKNYKGALLIVSHDRYFLDKVVNEVYEMAHHKIHHYKGNYSAYQEQKVARLAQEWKAYEKQQAQIEKLEDFVARNLVRASTTKRAQSRRKQLEKMDRLDRPQGDEKSMHLTFQFEKESGNVVLQAQDLAIGYPDKTLATHINLDIRKQQAIALIGPNGIGKTTLLKTLLGHLPALAGHFKIGANVSIGYYDQEQGNLPYQKDVLHALWDEFPTKPEQEIRTLLGAFLFSGTDVQKLVSSLSGGERARLLLAKLAMEGHNFLILDEPTNHLDLDSKEVLEEALIAFPGTLLFISHDRYFINRLATGILELTADGTSLYDGDYDYYLEKQLPPRQEATKEIKTQSQQQAHYQASRQEQRERRRLERDLEAIEGQIAQLEAEIEALHLTLAQSDVYSDHEKALTYQTELDQTQDKLDAAMTQWEEVTLALEAFDE